MARLNKLSDSSVGSWSNVPASPTATGTAGQVAYDSQSQYVCVAQNSWIRFQSAGWYQDQYRSSTTLLLPFDGTMADYSPSSKTVTVNGSASAFGQAKFGAFSLSLGDNYTGTVTQTQGSYRNTTNTGDWLDISDSSAFSFGSGNFTIELWYLPIARGEYARIFGATTDYPFTLYHGWGVNSGNPVFYAGPSSSAWFANCNLSFGAVTDNQWVHLAVVRQGDDFRAYKNGVQQSTGTTDSAGQSIGSTTNLRIGRLGDYYNKCRMDDFRVTKGICRYPDGTSFTPPAAALPTQ